jgi:hypothetical protein
MASLVFEQNLFRSPYVFRWMVVLKRFKLTRQDVLDVSKRYYGPQGMVVVVVGGISPKEVVERCGRPWEIAQLTATPSEELRTRPPCTTSAPDMCCQKKVRATGDGWVRAGRYSEDFLPASLGDSILGKLECWDGSEKWSASIRAGHICSANLNASLRAVHGKSGRRQTDEFAESDRFDH